MPGGIFVFMFVMWVYQQIGGLGCPVNHFLTRKMKKTAHFCRNFDDSTGVKCRGTGKLNGHVC